MKRSSLVAAMALSVALSGPLAADDWPAYRHDLARSGVTAEQLPTPLHRQWTHQPAHAPMPAWPEPGRELHRIAFDYVFDVVAANGLAYYGSSADGKVYALDLATGLVPWSFLTEGPVRFAPAVENGRVFVASDDGFLYCLSAGAGELLWKFRGGPRDAKLLGNGRMMSRWPLRSGVAVEGGTVYVTAGMWPSEGIYAYALNAETGEVVWENAASGTSYVTQPHPGSFSMTGVSPQGYVLGREGQIFLPTGRSVPAAFNRTTGELDYYRSQPTSWGNRWGGCWAFIADGLLFNWRCHIGPDIDILLGEFKPDKNDGMVAFDAKTGKELREFTGKLDAVVADGVLYATGSGTVTAYDLAKWIKGAKAADCTKWEASHGRAYAVVLAGKTLLVGGQGTVTAFDAAGGKQLWQDKVKGQARGLAVADGRLLASTTAGGIVCYGGEAVEQPAVVSAKQQAPAFDDERTAALARRILDETGTREGFCLALGAGDGELLYHLASESMLTICCVEPSKRRASRVRKALDGAGLHGVRVMVHQGSLEELAYPDYFADLILLGDGTSRRLSGCSAAEIYRVLRPCGGTVWIPPSGRGAALRTVGRFLGGGPYTAEAIALWLREGGVPEAEVQVTESAVRVVRGTLPETDDWTHQYACAGRTGASRDRRVRLPLKLLWFGEPGPARLTTRHWGGPAPLCVGGRMFVAGQRSIMAHDAYNGRPLWRRDFEQAAWWPTRARGASMAADGGSVYLVQGKVCLRLDAATGETKQTYQLPKAPAPISEAEAAKMRWCCLAVAGDRVLGMMGSDREGRAIFVLGKDGKNRWAQAALGTVGVNCLSMDDARVYAVERTSPAEVEKARRRGEKVPGAWRLVARDANAGKLAWQTAEGIEGRTELWLSEGVLVATSTSGLSGYDAAKGKLLYTRAVPVRRFPVIAGGTLYAEPFAYDLRTGEPKQRANPFSGDETQWEFHRSYGCGAIAGAPNILLFRSGTLGMYDLMGDGGVFNFGGVRAGCYVNAIAANGLVFSPPADAACTCSYSLRTTVALAPARQQRSWSVFYDRLPSGSVRQAALNLGATGDRRDPDGTLWLALPRPVTRTHRRDIAVPFRVTMQEGFGPYRRDSSRLGVRGTDRPWLYASGLKGLKRAEIDLQVLDRGIAAWRAAGPPKVDGHLIEPDWQHARPYRVEAEKAEVRVTHDALGLHLACRRDPAGVWKAATKGLDEAIWQDHSFEVFLSPLAAGNAPARKCLHLGVSASGARYDAAWTYVSPWPARSIPKLAVTIDGKADDWGDKGLKVVSLPAAGGKMRAAKNFDPSLRLAWSDQGVLILAVVRDDAIHEAPNASRLWEGDSVELFMTPRPGSGEMFQVVLSPGADPKQPKPRWRFYDSRRATKGQALTMKAAGAKTPDGYLIEAFLPWSNLKIDTARQIMFGLQVFVNDNDKPGGVKQAFRAQWHPGGHPLQNRDPHAFQRFQLASAPDEPIVFQRGPKPGKQGLYDAVKPYPFPLTVPPLGAKGEETRFNGEWSSKVRADSEGFVAEMTVPWTTLTAEGLSEDSLMIDFASRGPLRAAPRLGRGYERLVLVPTEAALPRPVSVRLHFAELDDVKRGQRVFDVKLGGVTVLKDFDVVRAARGSHRALVRQFDGIMATRTVTIELVPKAAELTPATAPILSAIEILPPRRPE